MKIPNKAYDVDFERSDYSVLHFFPRQNSRDESLRTLILPKWLSKALREEINYAERCGEKRLKDKLRELINL
jgi:hypothetical protein